MFIIVLQTFLAFCFTISKYQPNLTVKNYNTFQIKKSFNYIGTICIFFYIENWKQEKKCLSKFGFEDKKSWCRENSECGRHAIYIFDKLFLRICHVPGTIKPQWNKEEKTHTIQIALVRLGVRHATNNYKEMGRLLHWRHVETWGRHSKRKWNSLVSLGQSGRIHERGEIWADTWLIGSFCQAEMWTRSRWSRRAQGLVHDNRYGVFPWCWGIKCTERRNWPWAWVNGAARSSETLSTVLPSKGSIQ